MVTYHPMARATRDGFKPVVAIRRPGGKMLGTRTTDQHFTTREGALMFARQAALRAIVLCARDGAVAQLAEVR